MITPAAECERALRWLIANRRQDIPIEQALRRLCTVLPRDLATLQTLRRVAEEQDAGEPSRRFDARTFTGLPPRG